MNEETNRTICAVCTPLSEAGISIIRISGENAVPVADRIFVNKSHEHTLADYGSHTIHYGFIIDIRNNRDTLLDEVLVSVMKAPETYTCEDTVEINCHGGVYVTQSVLEDVICAGAELAEPGEFTKRAFLNGRIDLTEADAVMNIIEAKNDTAVRNSMKQLTGSVAGQIRDMREKIIGEIAHIEAALDDPEHIQLDGFKDELAATVSDISCRIRKLVKKADEGRLIQEGINTVIVGRPNVGKSALLNSISGHDRAIVTDIAGTTRDAIEETVRIGGIVLNLADTAGIRDTDDKIEMLGVDIAKQYAADADLILYVIDSSQPICDDDRRIIEFIRDKKVLVLLNKNDLSQMADVEEIRRLFGKTDVNIISVSAKYGSGIDEFEAEVKRMFFSEDISGDSDVLITSVRQKQLLSETLESLDRVRESLSNGMPEDFYTIDLQDAYEKLGMIIGEEMNDDVIDSIFSRFCMGK
jgi:tRNA modification GTPase